MREKNNANTDRRNSSLSSSAIKLNMTASLSPKPGHGQYTPLVIIVVATLSTVSYMEASPSLIQMFFVNFRYWFNVQNFLNISFHVESFALTQEAIILASGLLKD